MVGCLRGAHSGGEVSWGAKGGHSPWRGSCGLEPPSGVILLFLVSQDEFLSGT